MSKFVFEYSWSYVNVRSLFSVREAPKPAAATNPSKRHRERLNGELETVAALLPYDQSVISRFIYRTLSYLDVLLISGRHSFQMNAL